MSLTVSNDSRATVPPIPAGTYLGVCNMLIDLGLQFNEQFEKSSRKVLIGWEIPEETITIDGEEKPRLLTKRYTASLHDRAALRKDLAAWRGRDFTAEELKAFDLKNVLGASCMLSVIHREYQGRTIAGIQSIMSLPKGMPKGKPADVALTFDLDTDPLEKIDSLPGWIGDIIRQSETYAHRKAEEQSLEPPPMTEIPADADGLDEIPF